MHRRSFLPAGGAALTTAGALAAPDEDAPLANDGDRRPFTLKYAPHFGMFQSLAGKDPIDQLRFAADEGFVAWEDNDMKDRPRDEHVEGDQRERAEYIPC